jgi:hypothetical protein
VSVTEGLVQPFGYGLAYPDWLDVATPAAGATQSVTVDGAWSVRIVAARATLTTDANVANRLVTLDFVNARGVTYAANGASVVVTAGTSAQVFEWDRNRSVSEWNTNTPVWAPLLDEIIPPGFSVKFNVANIQVGDTLTSLRLWVEKFPTGARGYPRGMVPGGRFATAYDQAT